MVKRKSIHSKIELEKALLKGGFTKKWAKKLADKYTGYLNRVYGSESLRTKAKIAATLLYEGR